MVLTGQRPLASPHSGAAHRGWRSLCADRLQLGQASRLRGLLPNQRARHASPLQTQRIFYLINDFWGSSLDLCHFLRLLTSDFRPPICEACLARVIMGTVILTHSLIRRFVLNFTSGGGGTPPLHFYMEWGPGLEFGKRLAFNYPRPRRHKT